MLLKCRRVPIVRLMFVLFICLLGIQMKGTEKQRSRYCKAGGPSSLVKLKLISLPPCGAKETDFYTDEGREVSFPCP